jgi:hypothetical protein
VIEPQEHAREFKELLASHVKEKAATRWSGTAECEMLLLYLGRVQL